MNAENQYVTGLIWLESREKMIRGYEKSEGVQKICISLIT